MADAPITPDPEQQHSDNVASRRQSGLDPEPGDPLKQDADSEESSPSREERSDRDDPEGGSGEEDLPG